MTAKDQNQTTPAPALQGAPTDVAETVPFQWTDSQLDPLDEMTQGSLQGENEGVTQQDPFVAAVERLSKRLRCQEGNEEGVEEEDKTDDEVVEPIISHEQAEAMGLETYSIERSYTGESSQQEGHLQPEPSAQPAGQQLEEPLAGPKSPVSLKLPSDRRGVDSDEEINGDDKQQKRSSCSGTFKAGF